MKLSIHHVTTYRYRRPVALNAHRLMLLPRGSHDLSVAARTLRITPEPELDWTEDVFGNLIATAAFAGETAELVIASDLLVDQSAPAWPVFRIAPGAHSWPFDYGESERLDLGALLVPQHADPEGTLKAWARSFVWGERTDTLLLLKDINIGMLGRVLYRTRDEAGTQAPLETLALGSGSCRDIAALFIDVVRHLGFGARAVSGYLYDPDAGVDDAGSTHAWAEVYLPCAGWIAFDPTHQRLGSAGLIPVGVGRCNGQIMPVTGGYVGAPDDFLDMDVQVAVQPA